MTTECCEKRRSGEKTKSIPVSLFRVLKVLVNCDLDCMAPIHCVNLVNIADLLKTSRYQVKKTMQALVQKGYAQLEHEVIREDEFVLPYCGYGITEKTRKTPYYHEQDESEMELLKRLSEGSIFNA